MSIITTRTVIVAGTDYNIVVESDLTEGMVSIEASSTDATYFELTDIDNLILVLQAAKKEILKSEEESC